MMSIKWARSNIVKLHVYILITLLGYCNKNINTYQLSMIDECDWKLSGQKDSSR